MATRLDFEPFSAALRGNPYPAYRRLRDEAPLHWAPGAGCWCVSRYDDVLAVLNDPDRFSSEAMFSMLMNAGQQKAPELSWAALRFMAKMVFQVGLRPSRFAN